MAKKTFKPGENAEGGIISVECKSDIIMVEFKEWVSKKVILQRSFQLTGSRYSIEMYVADHATCYYGSCVVEWLDKQVPDPRAFKQSNGGW